MPRIMLRGDPFGVRFIEPMSALERNRGAGSVCIDVVNFLRERSVAFALQRYYDRRMTGSKLIELLAARFVFARAKSTPDARKWPPTWKGNGCRAAGVGWIRQYERVFVSTAHDTADDEIAIAIPAASVGELVEVALLGGCVGESRR
jgi:hypothetical protein